MLLRREEPASPLARRYGISDATLYRWRDEVLEGGQGAVANDESGQRFAYRAPAVPRHTSRTYSAEQPRFTNSQAANMSISW